MHFAHLIRDVWAPSPTLLDEQTFLLSEVIFGHFIHHFSTPASFMTWDKDIPRRIQDLLQWVVASGHTKIRPSCAFRAMLVILSIKKDIPNAVAFNDDIELLFMMAFKSLAATYYDPTFTDSVFDTLTDARYVGTKIEHYPHYLQGHLAQAVDDQRRKKFTAKIMEVVKFYLSPFLDAEVGGIPDESPAMPSYCELVRREPARHEQSLAFPDTLRKMSPLSPVMEEEMSAADPIHTMEDVEVGGMPENTTDAAGLSDFTIPTFPSFETETDSSSVSNPFDDKPQNSSIPSFPSSLTSMDSSASMGPAEGSKFHENISAQRAALPFPRARKVHFDVKDPGSSGSSSSSSSSSPSMHGVRHNPATQLNAVFEGQPAKASSTRFSAPMYESDPFPDPYSMSPTNVHQDSWGSRPETFVHAIDAFPMKQVRQWKANRRGKKAFAESGSSKPRSSNSSKSKLLPRLNSTRARARVVDHDDSSRLLARREAPDAQASAHGKWKRSSSPRPWKRLLVLPVAYVRLRIGQFRYGYE